MKKFINTTTFCTLICIFVPFFLLAQNVGIGTTTPTEKLHVNGHVRVDSLGSHGNGLIITDNDGKLNTLAYSGNENQVLKGDGTFAAVQEVNGISQNFVGFVTFPGNPTNYIYNSPNYKLYYVGNILYFEVTSTSYYAYGVSGNPYTEGFALSSQTIQINNGLEAIDFKATIGYNTLLKYEGFQAAGNKIAGILTVYH